MFYSQNIVNKVENFWKTCLLYDDGEFLVKDDLGKVSKHKLIVLSELFTNGGNISQPSWAEAGSLVELESTGKVGCQGVWDDEMHNKAESQPGAAEAGNWNCIYSLFQL